MKGVGYSASALKQLRKLGPGEGDPVAEIFRALDGSGPAQPGGNPNVDAAGCPIEGDAPGGVETGRRQVASYPCWMEKAQPGSERAFGEAQTAVSLWRVVLNAGDAPDVRASDEIRVQVNGKTRRFEVLDGGGMETEAVDYIVTVQEIG